MSQQNSAANEWPEDDCTLRLVRGPDSSPELAVEEPHLVIVEGRGRGLRKSPAGARPVRIGSARRQRPAGAPIRRCRATMRFWSPSVVSCCSYAIWDPPTVPTYRRSRFARPSSPPAA